MADEQTVTAYRDLPSEWKQVSSYRALVHIFCIWSAFILIVAGYHKYPNIFYYIAAVVFIGALQNNLNSLIHHSIHCNIHPMRWVNDVLTWLFLSGPLGQMYSRLKSEHLDHHAAFGAENDPERHYYDLNLHRRKSKYGLLRWVICVFFGWVLYPVVLRMITGDRSGRKPVKEKRSRAKLHALCDFISIAGCQTGLFFLLYFLTGNVWAYLLFWVLPISTFGAGFTALRGMLEHANPEEPDHLLITFTSNLVESFFIGPLNFNYHYEHHRFMHIPYYHIPKVHNFLKEKNDFSDGLVVKTYFGRLILLLKTLKKRPSSND